MKNPLIKKNELDNFQRLDQKRKLKLVTQIKKNIVKFDIKPDDIGFCNSLSLSNNF